MKLDFVHDLQSVYRKLVDATSRPGQIVNVEKEAELLAEENKTGCPSSILLLALTLLDAEVTFKVYGRNADAVEKEINQLTFAKTAEAALADYLFIQLDAEGGSLEEAIEKANPGTFLNPHKSAIIIAETGAITAGDRLTLRGPGIQTDTEISVHLNGEWVKRRESKNKDYPTGVDLVFVDQNHQLVSLPRTTQIMENREADAEWVM